MSRKRKAHKFRKQQNKQQHRKKPKQDKYPEQKKHNDDRYGDDNCYWLDPYGNLVAIKGGKTKSYHAGWYETDPEEVRKIAMRIFGTCVYQYHERVSN